MDYIVSYKGYIMNEAIAWLAANLPSTIDGILQIIGGFAVLAAMTENKSDNAILDAVLRFVNLFGANVGKARNA